MCIRDRNETNEASLLLQRALKVLRQSLGDDHPSTAYTRGLLGLAASDNNVVDDALDLLDSYPQGAFSSDHPWVAELGGFADVDRSPEYDLEGGLGSPGSHYSFGSLESSTSMMGEGEEGTRYQPANNDC